MKKLRASHHVIRRSHVILTLAVLVLVRVSMLSADRAGRTATTADFDASIRLTSVV